MRYTPCKKTTPSHRKARKLPRNIPTTQQASNNKTSPKQPLLHNLNQQLRNPQEPMRRSNQATRHLYTRTKHDHPHTLITNEVLMQGTPKCTFRNTVKTSTKPHMRKNSPGRKELCSKWRHSKSRKPRPSRRSRIRNRKGHHDRKLQQRGKLRRPKVSSSSNYLNQQPTTKSTSFQQRRKQPSREPTSRNRQAFVRKPRGRSPQGVVRTTKALHSKIPTTTM